MTRQLSEDRAGLAHPLIAVPSHDELAEQLFVRDLKLYIMQQIEPVQGQIAAREATALKGAEGNGTAALRKRMAEHESFGTWLAMKRESQRQLWHGVARSVERQAEELEELARIENPKGSVRTDPDLVEPEYIARGDIHLMPGGNAHDDGSLLQGAVMDRGGAGYMLRPQGRILN